MGRGRGRYCRILGRLLVIPYVDSPRLRRFTTVYRGDSWNVASSSELRQVILNSILFKDFQNICCARKGKRPFVTPKFAWCSLLL